MRITIVPLVFLAACSSKPATQTAPVDIANAAEEAQGSVDNYAAERPVTTPIPASAPDKTPASAPAPSPVVTEAPAPDADNVVAEMPFTPDGAQGAANVVQTYFALIEAGKYRRAWRLWGDSGRASGMSADAFAASFAKYREYHATIGAPGEIDAGAGQRYVTVPVKVYGKLRQGNRAFAMEGPVTLHRTGEIDGATPEQKSWRISTSGLRPRPDRAD